MLISRLYGHMQAIRSTKSVPGAHLIGGESRSASQSLSTRTKFGDQQYCRSRNFVRWKPQRSMYGSSTSKARGRTSKGDGPISDDVPSCLGNVFRLQLAPQLSGKCASYAFSPPAFWEVHYVQQPLPLHVCIRRMRRATCARDKVFWLLTCVRLPGW